jgi:16S rRNA (guanine966-N2)-methyltransferase
MPGLRVIGGKAKGRRLKAVPGDTTRPITDRTKESLFNILGSDIVSTSLLDLFAGTGSVGIEALSRGAAFVRFIDKNRLAVQTLFANLKETGLEQSGEVLRMDAFNVLESAPDRQFEYIFVAPPQYQELWKKAILSLDEHPGWMSEDAWVIVQIHPVEIAEVELKNLIEFDRRQYGSTVLIFYERTSD